MMPITGKKIFHTWLITIPACILVTFFSDNEIHGPFEHAIHDIVCNGGYALWLWIMLKYVWKD